ncbi:LysM domain-containing protein [Diaporthe helianthi]|uniref:LysM domain-containing protein n=1 Tax=Diaporthe helianthi TaxID=158607 RepID=A0A2P5HPB0_DIAHE|nr:LysM domain-containing protein [Diaporthe helianthi]
MLVLFVALVGLVPSAAAQSGDACPQAATFPDTISNCNLWHTVEDGDGCWSVQQEFGISADEFLEWNPSVSEDCLTTSTATSSGPSTTHQSTTYSTAVPITPYNLTTIATDTAWPPTRTKAGQPDYCRSWHLVQGRDTCQIVANQAETGVTADDIKAWNPTLGEDCSGLYVGWWVCNGIQSRTSVTLTWSTSAANATIPDPTPYTPPTSTSVDWSFTPTPSLAGMPDDCQAYHLAEENDTCRTVLATYSYLTRQHFFDWNPALGGNCDGLWLGYYYCVANFGSTSDVPLPTVTEKPTASTAQGSAASCTAWYISTPDDTCDSIISMFGRFSEADCVSWNPSLNSACGNLEPSLYYCVAVPGTPSSRTAAYTSTTASSSAAAVPTGCTSTWLVGIGDTCAHVSDANGLSLAEFAALNPQLGVSGLPLRQK